MRCRNKKSYKDSSIVTSRVHRNNLIMSVLLNGQVIPQLSCPIALFTYYNPILKRGIGEFMSTIRDVGVHGNV